MGTEIIKEVEIITLQWEKKSVDECLEAGVYQIYGDSPVYGTNVLLYIGKTLNLEKRISSHFESEVSFIGRQANKTCRYAKVDDEKLLAIVEQILIVMHKPSFNSSHIINISVPTKEKFYIIHNNGERGMLNLEVSNYYFLNKSELVTPN